MFQLLVIACSHTEQVHAMVTIVQQNNIFYFVYILPCRAIVECIYRNHLHMRIVYQMAQHVLEKVVEESTYFIDLTLSEYVSLPIHCVCESILFCSEDMLQESAVREHFNGRHTKRR